jgi:hypothetical protein
LKTIRVIQCEEPSSGKKPGLIAELSLPFHGQRQVEGTEREQAQWGKWKGHWDGRGFPKQG